MTADPGQWTGPARTYSFQWRRCDSGGAACSAIAAATRKNYLIVAADVGKTLRVTVVASNKNGSAAATSAATAVVTGVTATTSTSTATTTTSSAVPPSNTTSPTISGTPQQGQTLTAAPGSWSGTTPLSYAYQWKRCDTVGASCAAISGATNTAYLLASADVSSTIRVSVTASNSVGSATASSAPTAVVASLPVPSSTPPSGEVRYKKTGEGTANVYGTNSLEEACYPNLPPWNGIVEYCRWGKVMQHDPPQCGPFKDSSDPFAGVYSIRFDVATEQTVTRCEIDKHRRVGAYTHDWYHSAFKLEPDWGERNDGGAVIHQLNYQSIHGSPFFVHADDRNDSAYLTVSAGPCTSSGCQYYSGQPIGFGYAARPAGMPGPLYFIPAGGLTRGVWHEVLIHVYWTPLTDGVVEGWYRRKGGTWVKRVDVGPVGSGHATQFNFPTLQTGVQKVPQGCTTVTVQNINDDCHWPNVDKMGQYLDTAYTSGNGTNTMWEEFCRASSREAAETCLG